MSTPTETRGMVIIDPASLKAIVKEAVAEELAKVERDRNFPDRLLTSEEAADYLGLPSSNAVRIRVHRGELECVRIGRSLRFRKSHLDRSLSA